MNHLIKIFALAVVLSSCGGGSEQELTVPETLEEKRALLKEKRAELKTLNDFIAQLETAIAGEDLGQQERRRFLVTTAPVKRQNFQTFVDIQGAVQADDMVDATSEVPGRIVKLTVQEGDQVQRGQLIASLDMEQTQKQIAELETSLSLARTVFERQSRLWEQNIGSELQYLEAKNNKERLEKSLETLEHQLSRSEVYAPASGLVERVVLQSGELASPGMPIVQILNTAKLKVVANVPENYLRAVRKGEEVRIKFPALEEEQRARVSLVGSTINPANRTFEVEAAVSTMGGALKPNLLAVMMINDFTAKDVVTVPLEIVQEEVSGKKFVYIVEEGETGLLARKVDIRTGRSYEGEIIVTEGLQGDETLIMEGARGLADQALIQIQNEGKTATTNG